MEVNDSETLKFKYIEFQALNERDQSCGLNCLLFWYVLITAQRMHCNQSVHATRDHRSFTLLLEEECERGGNGS